jgi:hypothetical protein
LNLLQNQLQSLSSPSVIAAVAGAWLLSSTTSDSRRAINVMRRNLLGQFPVLLLFRYLVAFTDDVDVADFDVSKVISELLVRTVSIEI